MSTPTQAKRTFETPFGTAEITDSRYYSDFQDSRPRLASITIPEVTVNRKVYKDLHMELQRGWNGESAYEVTATGYNWRDYTEAARSKLREYFSGAEHAELYAPYLEPLDADDIRRQIKSTVRHKIGSAFYDTEGDKAFPDESKKLVTELIAEVLRDALEYTKDGKTFNAFYFDKD